jgi:hypothetical protein
LLDTEFQINSFDHQVQDQEDSAFVAELELAAGG